MTNLLTLLWFGWLVISIFVIFTVIGWSGLTSLFPEGKRGWHLLVQYLSLVNFAACVLLNPWH